jgi:hypothetical protein
MFRCFFVSDLPQKIMPAIEIAGLCLPLKPQKERGYEFVRGRQVSLRCCGTGIY